jgi:phospholipid N-methyltransferase
VTEQVAGGVARWDFLKAFVRDWHTVGAVAPTSRGVARKMASLGGVQYAKAIAELGPGTGAITRELLAALPPDGRMWAFEVYEPFARHLRETVHDARFTLLEQSAAEVPALRRREAPAGFDAVISSIPFSLIGPEGTREIVRGVAESLRPGGMFVALQYHPTYLRPYLLEAFEQVRRNPYAWNVPPWTLLLTARGVRRER